MYYYYTDPRVTETPLYCIIIQLYTFRDLMSRIHNIHIYYIIIILLFSYAIRQRKLGDHTSLRVVRGAVNDNDNDYIDLS